MPRNAIVDVPDGVFTELTANDVTSITIIHRGGGEVLLHGTTGAAPTDPPEDGFPLRVADESGHYIINRLMSDLFPHGTFDRVWATTLGQKAQILVMHA